MTTLLMASHAIHATLGRVRVCSLCMSSPWCGLNLDPARPFNPLGRAAVSPLRNGGVANEPADSVAMW
ncbi:hypothetical protein D9M72_440950 [compost metagenome]